MIRSDFHAAASGFCELAGTVTVEQWAAPGLGVWDVRQLVAHASRAFLTIETYLAPAAPVPPGSGVPADDPVAYLAAIAGDRPGSPERSARDKGIAARADETAAALGDDKAEAVRELADRVAALVDSTPDDATVATPAGPMTFSAYLPTRTMELAVHGLDLARALGRPAPVAMGPAVASTLVLLARAAASGDQAADVVLALCGRQPLPPHFAIV